MKVVRIDKKHDNIMEEFEIDEDESNVQTLKRFVEWLQVIGVATRYSDFVVCSDVEKVYRDGESFLVVND